MSRFFLLISSVPCEYGYILPLNMNTMLYVVIKHPLPGEYWGQCSSLSAEDLPQGAVSPSRIESSFLQKTDHTHHQLLLFFLLALPLAAPPSFVLSPLPPLLSSSPFLLLFNFKVFDNMEESAGKLWNAEDYIVSSYLEDCEAFKGQLDIFSPRSMLGSVEECE